MASWSPFALRDPLMALVWINIILWLVLGYVYYNDPAGVGRAINYPLGRRHVCITDAADLRQSGPLRHGERSAYYSALGFAGK